MVRNNKVLWLASSLVVFVLITYIYLNIQLEEKDKSKMDQYHRIDELILSDAIQVLSKRDKRRDAYFFIETAHGEIIKPRTLCSVESVAKLHPEADVYFLIASPPDRINLTPNYAVEVLKRHYLNVELLTLNLSAYFEDTPLENWYQSGLLNTSAYLVHHTSDVLRVLTIWKFGGTYLDSDIIIIKSLKGLHNYVSSESDEMIANAVINFEMNHSFPIKFLQEINNTFDGSGWVDNGPLVITRVIQRNCGNKPVSELTKIKCNGTTVFPPDKFYAIYYPEWKVMFDKTNYPNVLLEWKNSIGIHFWNKITWAENITVGSKQPLGLIAQHYCPRMYWSCNGVF